MQSRRCLLLAFLVGLAPCVWAQAGGTARATSPSAPGERGGLLDKVAVVVGLEYPGTDHWPVRWAVQDMTDVASALRFLGFDVTTFKNGDATASLVREGVAKAAQRVKPGGLLLFFFAGHGFGLLPVSGVGYGQNYLVTHGVNACDVRGQALPVGAVEAAMRKSPKGTHLVLIFDACRDPLPEKKCDDPLGRGFTVPNAQAPQDLATLFATPFGQPSVEEKDPRGSLRNGLFTHFLVKALLGANLSRPGKLSFSDVVAYVQREVPQHPLAKLKRGESELIQSPMLWGAFLPITLSEHVEVAELSLQARSEEKLTISGRSENKARPAIRHVLESKPGQHRLTVTPGVLEIHSETTGRRKLVKAQVGEVTVVEWPPVDPGIVRVEPPNGSPFEIYVTKVSRELYCQVRGFKECIGEGPVTGISWLDAERFCSELTALKGEKHRLPTRAELEAAAEHGPDELKRDLRGGVGEWTADAPLSTRERIVLGLDGWPEPKTAMLTEKYEKIGFRAVRDVKPQAPQ